MHIGSNFINVDWVLNGKLAQAQNGYFFFITTKSYMLRPNKKISVFRVTGLKILGRVGHTFFVLIF